MIVAESIRLFFGTYTDAETTLGFGFVGSEELEFHTLRNDIPYRLSRVRSFITTGRVNQDKPEWHPVSLTIDAPKRISIVREKAIKKHPKNQ